MPLKYALEQRVYKLPRYESIAAYEVTQQCWGICWKVYDLNACTVSVL